MLLENLGSKFEVCRIFRPNVEDVRKLGEDLNKQDHIVFVGGTGNSLDVNQDNSMKFSASLQRGQVTHVGFVNLLRRSDKPWLNGIVRNVNLCLDKALI